MKPESSEEYVDCVVCKVSLKKHNLKRHHKKCHQPKDLIVEKMDKIVWRDRPVKFSDFKDIRQYVDACIKGVDSESGRFIELVINDAYLLEKLLEEFEKKLSLIRPMKITAESRDFKTRAIKRLKMQLDMTSIQGRIIQTVNWQILPPGGDTLNRILEYYGEVCSKRPEVVIDKSRIIKIFNMSPDMIFKGDGGFFGYCAFWFKLKAIAVLECAQVGNAIYVVRGNWRKLSKLTKRQLLKVGGRNVTRIIHRGDWFDRLRTCLSD